MIETSFRKIAKGFNLEFSPLRWPKSVGSARLRRHSFRLQEIIFRGRSNAHLESLEYLIIAKYKNELLQALRAARARARAMQSSKKTWNTY